MVHSDGDQAPPFGVVAQVLNQPSLPIIPRFTQNRGTREIVRSCESHYCDRFRTLVRRLEPVVTCSHGHMRELVFSIPPLLILTSIRLSLFLSRLRKESNHNGMEQKHCGQDVESRVQEIACPQVITGYTMQGKMEHPRKQSQARA